MFQVIILQDAATACRILWQLDGIAGTTSTCICSQVDFGLVEYTKPILPLLYQANCKISFLTHKLYNYHLAMAGSRPGITSPCLCMCRGMCGLIHQIHEITQYEANCPINSGRSVLSKAVRLVRHIPIEVYDCIG